MAGIEQKVYPLPSGRKWRFILRNLPDKWLFEVDALGDSALARVSGSTLGYGPTATPITRIIDIELSKIALPPPESFTRTHEQLPPGLMLQTFINYYSASEEVHKAATAEQAAFIHGLGTACLCFLLRYVVASGYPLDTIIYVSSLGIPWNVDVGNPRAVRAANERLLKLYTDFGFIQADKSNLEWYLDTDGGVPMAGLLENLIKLCRAQPKQIALSDVAVQFPQQLSKEGLQLLQS